MILNAYRSLQCYWSTLHQRIVDDSVYSTYKKCIEAKYSTRESHYRPTPYDSMIVLFFISVFEDLWDPKDSILFESFAVTLWELRETVWDYISWIVE